MQKYKLVGNKLININLGLNIKKTKSSDTYNYGL
jgi:hypothetical protein